MHKIVKNERYQNIAKVFSSKFESLKQGYIPDDAVEEISKIKDVVSDKSVPIIKMVVQQARTLSRKWHVSGAVSHAMAFFVKLARGEFGLAKTYWLYGVLISWLIGAISLFGAFRLLMLCNIVFQIIVLFGIWRASNQYTGSIIWRILAKISVVLNGLWFVALIIAVFTVLLE